MRRQIPRIIGLVSGATVFGLSIAVLVGAVKTVEEKVSLFTVALLFAGLGLIVICANALTNRSRDQS